MKSIKFPFYFNYLTIYLEKVMEMIKDIKKAFYTKKIPKYQKFSSIKIFSLQIKIEGIEHKCIGNIDQNKSFYQDYNTCTFDVDKSKELLM